MENTFEIIKNDVELRCLILEAMKFEGRPYSVAAKMSEVRQKLWENHQIDVEIYT